MQNIIVLKPYRFVPPYTSVFWMYAFRSYLPVNLRRNWGVAPVEYRGVEHLKDSIAAGHGIILAPNHCRPNDPVTMGMLGAHVDKPFLTMASWHLFMGSRFTRWLYRRIGAFSLYREGVDREATQCQRQSCNVGESSGLVKSGEGETDNGSAGKSGDRPSDIRLGFDRVGTIPNLRPSN